MNSFKNALIGLILSLAFTPCVNIFAAEPCPYNNHQDTVLNPCANMNAPIHNVTNQSYKLLNVAFNFKSKRMARYYPSAVGACDVKSESNQDFSTPSYKQNKFHENEEALAYVNANSQDLIGKVASASPHKSLISYLEYYPKEPLYGDSVYILWYDENDSNDILKINMFNLHDPQIQITIRRNDCVDSYQYKIEVNDTLITKRPEDKGQKIKQYDEIAEELKKNLGLKDFWLSKEAYVEPHKKLEQLPIVLEFPPLEDWENPFWKKMRTDMTSDGIECNVEISFYLRRFSFPVVIKPRPSVETDCFSQWYSSTPPELWPKGNLWNRKITWREFDDDRSVELSPVCIKDALYPLYLFTRYGNRKPNVPNNPRDLSQWQTLETMFQESTVRDEITFIRKQLEYYNSETPEEQQVMLNELICWIKSRPEPQRVVFTKTILERYMRDFDIAKPLRKELKNLLQKLAPYDLLYLEDINLQLQRFKSLQERYEKQERDNGRWLEQKEQLFYL